MPRGHYEIDHEHFSAPAYRVAGSEGVAYHCMGWETAPDEDTEWSGIEPRTGRVVVRMVGDDHNYVVDEDDLTPLSTDDYCPGCGQTGCKAYQ